MFKVFGKGSSSNAWNPLENAEQDIVKVHENVNARALGLNSYANRTVRVSSPALEHLKAASWANRVSKQILNSGAGNQETDIHATSGESWAREILGQDAKLPQLQRAQVTQGGNCPVHAAVAVAVLEKSALTAPLQRRRQTLPNGNSHEFLLIGDPRVSQWGDRNTVVVDPWPGHPSACTLDQAVLYDAKTGNALPLVRLSGELREETWTERALDKKDARRMENIQPMDTEKVNKKLMKKNLPAIGEQLVAHIHQEEQGNVRRGRPQLFDVRVATDPSTRYTDDHTHSGNTFDDISLRVINRQRRGRG
ncbi:hypothetical protein [Collimonas fungivorans]|nr:hypothetical protein [Collimonas fungivorans]